MHLQAPRSLSPILRHYVAFPPHCARDYSRRTITHDIIMGRERHPHIDDGIVTFYFENEQTRDAYIHMPFDHPFPKLPSQPSPEDDRGG